MVNSKSSYLSPLVPPILVNSQEAARRLAISPRKLWDLTASGEIPSLKIGSSVRYHLEAWAEKKVQIAGV